MGQKITYRSRPRPDSLGILPIGSPTGNSVWPYVHGNGIVTGYDPAKVTGFGPLTIGQLFELLFRVKEFTLDYERLVYLSDPAEWVPESLNYARVPTNTGLNVFSDTFTDAAAQYKEIDAYTQVALGSVGIAATIAGDGYDWIWDDIALQCFQVPDGRFWVNFPFIHPFLSAGQPMDGYPAEYPDSYAYLSGTLSGLHSGSSIGTRHVVYSSVPGEVRNMTWTATKWLPYATKAGDPAWSTTTGAPANGGPGA